MDIVGDNPNIVSIGQAEGRGYLLLPHNTTLTASLASGFSVSLANQPKRNPFGVELPFDVEDLNSMIIYYHRSENCRGTYATRSTSMTSVASDHMSLNLGIGIGNEYLGGSVSGIYDKAVLRADTTVRTSQRTAFQAGAIHMSRPPRLSTQALATLKSADGLEGFRQRYGDFYVTSVLVGGEAAVVVNSVLDRDESAENIKLTAEAHAVCFSRKKTLAESSVATATQSLTFGVTAFDSLTQHVADIPLRDGVGLKLEDARALANQFNDYVQHMDSRVEAALKQDKLSTMHEIILAWHDIGRIMLSGLITQLVLVPYTTLREIQAVPT